MMETFYTGGIPGAILKPYYKRGCEDILRSSSSPGFRIAVLADGAGSCIHSAEGAEETAEFFLEQMEQYFEVFYENPSFGTEMLIAALQKRLKKYAGEREIPYDSLAATAVVLAVKDSRYLIVHIGDGCVFRADVQGNMELLSAPENGRYACETFFVTDADADRHLRIRTGQTEDTISFFLMTDGMADVLGDSELLEWFAKQSVVFPDKYFVFDYLEDVFTACIYPDLRDDASIAFVPVYEKLPEVLERYSIGRKAEIFGIYPGRQNYKRTVRQIKRWTEQFLLFRQMEDASDHEIARKLHIKKKYVRRKRERFCRRHLL